MADRPRSLAVVTAVLAVAVFAFSCRDGEDAAPASPAPTSTTTGQPSPTAGEIDLASLALGPDDVPVAIARFAAPVLTTAQEAIDAGEFTRSDVDASGLQSTAVQVYNGPGPYPEQGARFAQVALYLHADAAGAAAFLTKLRAEFSREAVERQEAGPGRNLLDYQELSEPAFGDESYAGTYVSRDPDDTVRLEAYLIVFRRGRVTAAILVQAPEGNVTLDQLAGIADVLDSRIEVALGPP